MDLYDDQELVAVKFEDWLNNSNVQTAGLWASAGYGKSYMVKHLIEDVILKNSNYTPILTSMTHSAVAVLTSFTGMGVSTLHGLMGWVPIVDKDTGEEKLSTPRMRDPGADPRLTGNMLVIVDEAGLMGHDELGLLLNECTETGARVLFIGDNKQCYPVMKDHQRLCIPAYENTECMLELTIPKRVDKDDMIYKLSTTYRLTVDGARQPKLKTMLNTDNSGKGVRHVDDLEKWAYMAFETGVKAGNTRNIKVLAFTNQRCLNLNRKIRKKVMGIDDPTPVVGEEMVANTAITNAVGEEVLIRNNQLVVVASVEKTDSYGMPGAFIQFTDAEGEDIQEVVFVPSSPSKLQDRLKELAKKAKANKKFSVAKDKEGLHDEAELYRVEAKKCWRSFYSLKEGCADIRFTYAMTVNKAQGTTLKHALIDLYDMNGCRDAGQAARLAYTAVSRATDYVTIEGELTKLVRN